MNVRKSSTPQTESNNPTTTIHLKGQLEATIDYDDFPSLNLFHWTAHHSHHGWYAIRKVTISGKRRIIFMHRQLLHAPPELDVHHINHNTLDNRRSNLVMLSPAHHHITHDVARISKTNLPGSPNLQPFLHARFSNDIPQPPQLPTESIHSP